MFLSAYIKQFVLKQCKVSIYEQTHQLHEHLISSCTRDGQHIYSANCILVELTILMIS